MTATRPLLMLPPTLLAAGLAVSLSGCSVALVPDSSSSARGSATPSVGSGSAGITNGPCSGRSFTVDEEGAELSLSGDCGDVVVRADRVSLNLDGAKSITISGDRATVIAVKKIGTLSVSGEEAAINGVDMGAVSLTGEKATVIAARIDQLDVAGEENTVNWDSGVPSADDTGEHNTFVFNG